MFHGLVVEHFHDKYFMYGVRGFWQYLSYELIFEYELGTNITFYHNIIIKFVVVLSLFNVRPRILCYPRFRFKPLGMCGYNYSVLYYKMRE